MNDRCSLWGKFLSSMIRLRLNVTTTCMSRLLEFGVGRGGEGGKTIYPTGVHLLLTSYGGPDCPSSSSAGAWPPETACTGSGRAGRHWSAGGGTKSSGERRWTASDDQALKRTSLPARLKNKTENIK